MTYEEALKEFKDSIDSGHALMPSHEAWLRAVEALERQIPHKPMRIEPITVQGGMWTCECGHWLVECMSWLEYTKPKYCSCCGRKIDWEVEE